MEKCARVLFVLGKYHPQAGANGVCVSRVQQALLKKGVCSDVIVEGEGDRLFPNEYGTVYETEVQNAGKVPKLQRIMAALRYPLYFPDNICRYAMAIDKALSQNHYDAVISVLKPLDGALAVADYSNSIIYELDSVSNNDDNEHGYKRILRYRTYRYEKYLYKKANYIFHMLSHEAFYSQSQYDSFRQKSDFLDIPQLVDEGIVDRAANDLDNIKILYSGILNSKMRSPEYAITLVKGLSREKKLQIEVNFYSRGNCEDLLTAAEAETDGKIKKRGYVTLEALNQAVSATDVLLSIGNCLTGKVTSLPSKVISYMAYGKPIIHIDGGSNDVAKEYLAQYPLALVVDPKRDLQENMDQVDAFLRDSIGKRVPFADLEKIFEKNTPQYTADQMLERIESVCTGHVRKINCRKNLMK